MFVLLVLLLFSNSLLAKERDYDFSTLESCRDIVDFIKFNSLPTPVFKDGIKFEIVKPFGLSGLNSYSLLSADQFFTGDKYYIGTLGVYIAITNETDSTVKIVWRDSVIYVNNISYGIPFLRGNMSELDAGNYSATPSTIIPPKRSAVVLPTVSTIEESASGRYRYITPVPMPRKFSLKFSYYLYVITNDKSSYITLETPAIYLPPISETMPQKTKK